MGSNMFMFNQSVPICIFKRYFELENRRGFRSNYVCIIKYVEIEQFVDNWVLFKLDTSWIDKLITNINVYINICDVNNC